MFYITSLITFFTKSYIYSKPGVIFISLICVGGLCTLFYFGVFYLNIRYLNPLLNLINSDLENIQATDMADTILPNAQNLLINEYLINAKWHPFFQYNEESFYCYRHTVLNMSEKDAYFDKQTFKLTASSWNNMVQNLTPEQLYNYLKYYIQTEIATNENVQHFFRHQTEALKILTAANCLENASWNIPLSAVEIKQKFPYLQMTYDEFIHHPKYVELLNMCKTLMDTYEKNPRIVGLLAHWNHEKIFALALPEINVKHVEIQNNLNHLKELRQELITNHEKVLNQAEIIPNKPLINEPFVNEPDIVKKEVIINKRGHFGVVTVFAIAIGVIVIAVASHGTVTLKV